MVGWFFGGAVYVARAVEYSVQIGWTRSGPFEWLLLLTGFRASESGVDCRILLVVAVNTAFIFASTRPAIVVLSVRTTSIFAEVVAAS